MNVSDAAPAASLRGEQQIALTVERGHILGLGRRPVQLALEGVTPEMVRRAAPSALRSRSGTRLRQHASRVVPNNILRLVRQHVRGAQRGALGVRITRRAVSVRVDLD
jgi:hypothetical protein